MVGLCCFAPLGKAFLFAQKVKAKNGWKDIFSNQQIPSAWPPQAHCPCHPRSHLIQKAPKTDEKASNVVVLDTVSPKPASFSTPNPGRGKSVWVEWL